MSDDIRDIAERADDLRYRLEASADKGRGARLSSDQCRMVAAALDYYATQVRDVWEHADDPLSLDNRMSV